MKVLVTGSLSYDYIMDFPGRFADRIMPDKIHTISLSFLVDKLSKQIGGTAGNIAYTLKLLGNEPLIASCAGNDFAPYGAFLRRQQISTKYIKKFSNVETSAYFVITDKDDNQIGSFYVGASKYNQSLLLAKIIPQVQFAVIAPNTPEAMKRYVRLCQKHSLPYLYDPAFQIAHFTSSELREAISGSAILIGNDYEMALIEEKIGASHKELIRLAPIAITTLAGKGSIIEKQKARIHIRAAKPENISDPTGAGDAYRAGFLAGYLRYLDRAFERQSQGLTLEELRVCGQMGSVAAVYTVEKYGTVTHRFTKKEFIRRYAENYGNRLTL